ncbi:PilN domain-containing protein [Vulcanococcus sp.]|uniref:PilN domain-containing protein n=1 Tax=Vulcanococcus sp. TaxID=2856995 RepID=UPI003C0E503A
MNRSQLRLDLLQERRRQRGLPDPATHWLPARRLLLAGGAVGSALVALVVLLALAMAWRQQQVAAALDGLRPIAAEVEVLERRVTQTRRAKSQVQRSNEGLAQGLVAVSSGSALLTQLMAVTPEGVQLTEVRAQGDGLVLKGVASDPQAFRRVNSLSLLLARSPLLESRSLKVVNLQRDGEASTGVNWELSARFGVLPAPQLLEVLQALQADGLARRLRLLQSAGVLP